MEIWRIEPQFLQCKCNVLNPLYYIPVVLNKNMKYFYLKVNKLGYL